MDDRDGAPSTALSAEELRDRIVMLAALLACGAFPLAMLVARTTITDELSYDFLAWNLFLAALPVVFALGLETAMRHRLGWQSAVLGAMWLGFFPNCPYVMTDLIHLHERPPSPLWFDALILVSAAFAGLLAGFVSLRLVHHAVARRWRESFGWAVSMVVLGLSGFGVYLGRFARLNSWDLFTRPRSLLYSTRAAASPPDRFRAVVVTALFSSFLIVSYATVVLVGRVTSYRTADRLRPPP